MTEVYSKLNGEPCVVNQNIVRDFNQVQGTYHPGELAYRPPRDINVRHITLENSSPRHIDVAIVPYLSGPTPPRRFVVRGGEIKHIAINSQGGPDQALWLLDVKTGKSISEPTLLHRHVNSFVLRDGVNKWWVQFFKRPSFHAPN